MCELFSNQKKGGAPKKIKGRPKTIPADLHFNHRSDDIFAELNSSISSAECSTQNIEIVGLTEGNTMLKLTLPFKKRSQLLEEDRRKGWCLRMITLEKPKVKNK